MNCPACKQSYSADEQAQPRLLPKCGHSLCTKCLRILIISCGLCPTCKQTPLTQLSLDECPLNQSLILLGDHSQTTDLFSAVFMVDDDLCTRH